MQAQAARALAVGRKAKLSAMILPSSSPVSWLLALAVLLQFPYRLLSLRRADQAPLGRTAPRLIASLLIVLLIGNWLVDLLVPGLHGSP